MIILFQIRRGSFQTDAAIGVPVVDDSPQRRSAFATGVGRMEQIDIANTKFAGFYSYIRFVRFLWRQR